MKFEDFKLGSSWNIDDVSTFRNFYNEIWQGGEYDRFGVSVTEGDVVVDLGASIGLFSQYANSKGASKIYAFECIEERYELIKENCKYSPNITPILGLVGSDSYGTNYNLQRIFDDLQLNTVDFMKVDIEGFEYDFILSTSDYLLNKVSKWAIEVHIWGMYRNDTTEYIKLLEVMERFSKNGFKISVEKIHKNTVLYMLYITKK
jgi:tRNA G37 N-methylase Trm5